MSLLTTKYEIKAYTLAESKTGYILDFEIYEGKKHNASINKNEINSNNYNNNININNNGNRISNILSEEVVRKYMSNYEREHFILFTDSFYTSPNLCEELHKKGIAFYRNVQK